MNLPEVDKPKKGRIIVTITERSASMFTKPLRYYGRKSIALMCCCLFAALPCETLQAVRLKEGDTDMRFELSSTAFKPGTYIPRKYSGEGADVSPPLQWVQPPAGALSFALICDDPDAPAGTWVHWVLFNIPAHALALPEGMPTEKELPDGSHQGINDFRKMGYGGPMPPRGSDHRYFFRLYALDIPLVLNPGAKKSDLLKAMENHILGQAELMGRYKR